MASVHAFDFLRDSAAGDLPPIIALSGDDAALRRWVRSAVFQRSDADVTEMDGDSSQWRDLRDAVATGSLFAAAGRRLVLVRPADAFLKRFRSELEEYAARPASTSCLVLELQSLPANTRFYKALAAHHLVVDCGVPTVRSGRSSRPDTGKLAEFLTTTIAAENRCRLQKTAAVALIDLVGNDVGMLETEVAKLAASLPLDATITEQEVRDHVGGWRTKTTWEIIDAAAAGNAAEALAHLDRLLASGESPVALLPQIAWSLRRLGLATAAVDYAEARGKRTSVGQALGQAGVAGFQAKKAENQLRQIGRARGREILGWLREADLKLKGSHSTDNRGRWVLEELFLKLARQ